MRSIYKTVIFFGTLFNYLIFKQWKAFEDSALLIGNRAVIAKVYEIKKFECQNTFVTASCKYFSPFLSKFRQPVEKLKLIQLWFASNMHWYCEYRVVPPATYVHQSCTKVKKRLFDNICHRMRPIVRHKWSLSLSWIFYQEKYIDKVPLTIRKRIDWRQPQKSINKFSIPDWSHFRPFNWVNHDNGVKLWTVGASNMKCLIFI